MKKYKWHSGKLKKKSERYYWLCFVCALVTLALLYMLPESSKMWNMLPLVLAICMWVLAWRVQSKDKKLGK